MFLGGAGDGFSLSWESADCWRRLLLALPAEWETPGCRDERVCAGGGVYMRKMIKLRVCVCVCGYT